LRGYVRWSVISSNPYADAFETRSRTIENIVPAGAKVYWAARLFQKASNRTTVASFAGQTRGAADKKTLKPTKETTMTRIAIPTDAQTPAASKPLLAAVQKQLGVVPNLMKLVGNSPAALEGYLSLNGALTKGALDVQLRERIALATAEANACEYCLAAHTYLGKNVAKLNDAEMAAARDFQSPDAKSNAALKFAQAVISTRGAVSDGDVTAVKEAGFDDAGVVEIVVNIALNVLTNYVNNVSRTTLDFPAAGPKA
jgi:uncharacterized peroxidase-related enzyme